MTPEQESLLLQIVNKEFVTVYAIEVEDEEGCVNWVSFHWTEEEARRMVEVHQPNESYPLTIIEINLNIHSTSLT